MVSKPAGYEATPGLLGRALPLLQSWSRILRGGAQLWRGHDALRQGGVGCAVLGQHAALPSALGALLQGGAGEHQGLRQLLPRVVLRQELVQPLQVLLVQAQVQALVLPVALPRLALALRLAGVPRHLAVPLQLLLLRQKLGAGQLVLGAGLLPLRLLCHLGVLLLHMPLHLLRCGVLQLRGGLQVALHVLLQLVAAQALQLVPRVAGQLPRARQAQLCPLVLRDVLLLTLLLLLLVCQVQMVWVGAVGLAGNLQQSVRRPHLAVRHLLHAQRP